MIDAAMIGGLALIGFLVYLALVFAIRFTIRSIRRRFAEGRL
jgi:hypothetical protein